MGAGYLRVQVRTGPGLIPVEGAGVVVSYPGERLIARIATDKNGNTGTLRITAPDKRHTLDPNFLGPVYAAVNVVIKKTGFVTYHISNVQIFDTATTILPQNIEPLIDGGATDKYIEIPPPGLTRHPCPPAVPQDASCTAVSCEFPGTPLKTGSSGREVRLMQTYLSILRTAYPAMPAISADGVFGHGTESAVASFQKLFGLIPDGIIGPDTWCAIIDQVCQLLPV